MIAFMGAHRDIYDVERQTSLSSFKKVLEKRLASSMLLLPASPADQFVLLLPAGGDVEQFNHAQVTGAH
ncbi:hypothetical protein FPJ27_14785 [Burkholderia sp. MS455]|uniref:hypothetical protein n=1 Tax=Burkholderia sp. MS455 TaxID=2811788 RepID=UPI001956F9C5|nr:hypothetical protein [Burkholderia sp. MS455]QRR07563.1 hypothetical protein FPJ27_14785 [Burkholderia sp. MS455]